MEGGRKERDSIFSLRRWEDGGTFVRMKEGGRTNWLEGTRIERERLQLRKEGEGVLRTSECHRTLERENECLP
jgi:hypothetical protein